MTRAAVNIVKDHDSRHDSVVVHRRGFGAYARGVDEVRVTSEAAHGIQMSDIEKQVAGFRVGNVSNICAR